MKILKAREVHRGRRERDHLTQLMQHSDGSLAVQMLQDSFEMKSPNGTHVVIVMELLAVSVDAVTERNDKRQHVAGLISAQGILPDANLAKLSCSNGIQRVIRFTIISSSLL